MQQSRVALARTGKLKCARSFSISCRRSRVLPPQIDAISALTEQIIDTAALQQPPEGWRHTPELRGSENRLKNAIQTINSASRAPSMDKHAFEVAGDAAGLSDESPDDEEGFTPGTFVELRRNEISTHGVVLGEQYKDSRWHVITLASTGEVWDPLRDDVMFSVPALTSPELAQRCSVNELATGQGQQSARIKVLQSIRQVERAVETATAELIKQHMDVYALVKSRDPNEWATTTVAEVARLFSPKPTLVTVFATHKYLMGKAEYFVPNHSYRIAQSFDVRPESHLKTLNTVTEWCRKGHRALDDFVQRAIPVIQANRQLYLETYNEQPSQRPAKHAWTPDDITIITFLHHALRPTRSIQSDPYSIGQSAIMRKLDANAAVDDHQVHMALVDLGVYAPWQDVYSLRRDLNLDPEDPSTSAKVQAVDALVRRSLSTPVRSGPLSPEDFHTSDPLEHIRHDFGDMPIYVVDDANAKELDDGISIEGVTGEPESYWVHVHIADPASVIPHTHILAQRAAKQSQSTYFVHRSWPLFPKSLMFSGTPGFSLSEAENRVLTFSSKINSTGELVESVVRAGVARNFVKLSYDEVDMALTGRTMARFYPFNLPPAPPPTPQLSNQQLDDLRKLNMIRERIVKHRLSKGIIEANNETANFKDFTIPPDIESPIMRGSEFRGFPQLSPFVTTMDVNSVNARGIITEAMKLGCRTASRWCVERGVDVLYRTATPLEGTPEALEKLRAMRDENGWVDVAVIASMASVMPMADYSLSPGAHWSMLASEGEGYSRVTSPLRRFSDLLAHYQIHASLLGQKLPFSPEYLQEYKHWLKADDRLKKRSNTLHLRTWVLIALKRWMEAPRTNVPDPVSDLHAVLMRPPRSNSLANDTQSEVRIPSLGISANLVGISDKFANNWQISSSVRVKVKEIKLGVRPSLVVTTDR
ncbi:hypothetical protein C8R44DRAFT_667467 [Mycena epipterygia]|nr:hypothetical protein C8R44DRAFT_667467 [Mycena epipterygia]